MNISIVTPTYNAMPYLEYCIESVRFVFGRSDSRNITYEHIIVDGGSTDGTVEYLMKQSDVTWISEPDNGMYDALNKGIGMASGKWIGHLNSDEQYNRTGFLTAYRHGESSHCDAVMGPTVMVDKNLHFIQFFKQIIVPSLYDVYWCMPVQSCSLLYKKVLWEKHPYDTNYKLVADHAWFRSVMEDGIQIDRILDPFGIFVWRPDNLSNTSRDSENEEDALADINRKAFHLKIVKHWYRFRKWLAGGYKPTAIAYQIFTAVGLEDVVISEPKLTKVK